MHVWKFPLIDNKNKLYTYCCKFYSDKNKHTINCLSTGEQCEKQEYIPKNLTKKSILNKYM